MPSKVMFRGFEDVGAFILGRPLRKRAGQVVVAGDEPIIEPELALFLALGGVARPPPADVPDLWAVLPGPDEEEGTEVLPPPMQGHVLDPSPQAHTVKSGGPRHGVQLARGTRLTRRVA